MPVPCPGETRCSSARRVGAAWWPASPQLDWAVRLVGRTGLVPAAPPSEQPQRISPRPHANRNAAVRPGIPLVTHGERRETEGRQESGLPKSAATLVVLGLSARLAAKPLAEVSESGAQLVVALRVKTAIHQTGAAAPTPQAAAVAGVPMLVRSLYLAGANLFLAMLVDLRQGAEAHSAGSSVVGRGLLLTPQAAAELEMKRKPQGRLAQAGVATPVSAHPQQRAG
jgi:hypothetical protein